MKNMTELRNTLYSQVDELRSGMLDIKTAGELNNTAGKILKVRKQELEEALALDKFPKLMLKAEEPGNAPPVKLMSRSLRQGQ